MTEEINMSEVVSEIKNSNEDDLKKVIENWFESTRTQGMKIGAQFISAAIYGVIQKNLIKKEKASLRDYKRAIDAILNIISVQLKTEQNESVEENNNDRTTEAVSQSDSIDN